MKNILSYIVTRFRVTFCIIVLPVSFVSAQGEEIKNSKYLMEVDQIEIDCCAKASESNISNCFGFMVSPWYCSTKK